MKNNRIDADKIVRHIKYTKHWLDKANSDFQDKNFASGSAVLNIARAELTTAWEEAMQLKKDIFTQLPKKARANWKPAASVGLLASGFMIAIILYQFTGGRAPQTGVSDSSAPAIVLPQESAQTAAPAENLVPQTAATESKQPARASRISAKHTANKPAQAETRTSVPAPAEHAAGVSIPPYEYERRLAPAQEPMPFSSVGPQTTTEPQAQPAVTKTSELNQSEVIELFRTAESSLRK